MLVHSKLFNSLSKRCRGKRPFAAKEHTAHTHELKAVLAGQL